MTPSHDPSSDGPHGRGRALASEEALDRALARLGPVPPPPPLSRVLARLDVRPTWTRPFGWVSPFRVFAACAVGLALVLGVLIRDATRATQARRARDATTGVAGEVLAGAPRLLRADGSLDLRAPEARALAVGDTVTASAPARLRWGADVELTLDAGASVRFDGPAEIFALGGRSRYEVGSRAETGTASSPTPRLRVRARHLEVLDVGTRFALDVDPTPTPDAPTSVRVTVEEGLVEANGVRVEAGWGIAFLDGVPEGASWPIEARPQVHLETEAPEAEAGRPVLLRVVLSNPTGGWISLPEPDAVRAPVWIEIGAPGGATVPVRVTAAMLEPSPSGVSGSSTPGLAAAGIPPRGHVSFRVRFERTFASPGTYRLRAVYRPAGAPDYPASPELVLHVR